MSSEWISNETVNKRVKELLEQAGVPLEIQTTNICKQFCKFHESKKRQSLRAERVVYATSPDDQTYRELDCKVQIYEEFEVSRQIGIQLIVEIPIECKYRKDVETFGFSLTDDSTNDLPFEYSFGFPIISYFARTNYLLGLVKSYKNIRDPAPHRISLIQIKAGKTPNKIHEENLVFNSASSLYDFVQMDLREVNDVQSDPIIERLLKSFQDYIASTHYGWFIVVRSWAQANIHDKDVKMFNDRNFGDRPLYHGVTAYLPIICMNGPLYLVHMTPDLHIDKFEEKPFLSSSIRKQGWPSDYSSSVVFHSPEVSVFVTNPRGLEQVLEMGLKWHGSIRRILESAPREVIERAPLEAQFFNRVVTYYEANEERQHYRSDLDLRNWF
jgi:hypothetical protein